MISRRIGFSAHAARAVKSTSMSTTLDLIRQSIVDQGLHVFSKGARLGARDGIMNISVVE